MSPDYGNWLLLTSLQNPSISELAQDELKLAGMRFSPLTYAPTRGGRHIHLALMSNPDLSITDIIGMPVDPRVLSTAWSPDGSKVVFTNETPEGIELWIIDAETAVADRLTGPVLSCTANEFPRWCSDGQTVICCMIPDDHGDPPSEDPIPAGPMTDLCP